MRLGMHGNLSNGDGLYTFYDYEVDLFEKLLGDIYCIWLMNYILCKFLKEKFSFSDPALQDVYIEWAVISKKFPYRSKSQKDKREKFRKTLRKLKKMNLIKFTDNGLLVWEISLL